MKPKLRFKGYNEEWKEKSLSDYGKCQSGIGFPEIEQGGKDGFAFYKVSDMNTPGNESEMHISNNYVNTEQLNRRGWKLITELPAIIFAKVGAAVMLNRKRLVQTPFLIDNNMMAFKIMKNVDIPYFSYIFQNINLPSLIQVGALPSINGSDVETIPIIILENINEQKAIGEYFRKLDGLIKEAGKEIEKLENMKKSSLQKMFPQPGESVPQLRFKGFTEPWQEKRLEEYLDIDNNRNIEEHYGINDVLSVSGEFGVVNQIQFQGRSFAGESLINYKIARPNQIIYTKSPLKAQPFGIVKNNQYGIGIVSPLYAVYNPKENAYADFIHYYFSLIPRLNNYLRPLINKGAKNTLLISDEIAIQGEVIFPTSIDEQKAIGEYFRNLDKMISAKKKKLEKLKQIKASCLNLMFV